jgi:excisionase family DNA binding protein
MGVRNYNHRLVKIHRTYTVDEMARLFGAHRNTVRAWLRDGLSPVDRRRPVLVRGQDLVSFLRARRAANKRPCQRGEIYCMKCREPRSPADGRLFYQPMTCTGGNLVGSCPQCGTRMFRRVNLGRLADVVGDLVVAAPEAQQHIAESHQASVNCDFR